ncbi:MAG: phosphoribosylglycinamide formyltransferase [Acholeplasmataceae bacterium]|nr:phosphoribosylglycinamide formyltransferase [Acholeplasmataceae bacterium]
MVNVAVFASGNGSNFEALVRRAKLYEVRCLIVDQENAYAITRAKNLNIPYYFIDRDQYQSRKDYESAILKILDSYQIEWIALAGYMRIVGQTLMKAYPNHILNIHPSLLPLFPGKQAILDAYENQVKLTGVTVFIIDEGIDTGKIVAQEAITIKENMKLEDLENQIHQVEHEIFSNTLHDLIGGKI